MEFLDEYESKPRFLFQSKNLPDDSLHPSSFSLSSLHKPTLFISLSLSLLLFCLALIYFNFEPLQSLLLWLSLSLLVGPFAPPSLTAGDIRVGLGPPLQEIPDAPLETIEKPSRKSTKSVRKAIEDAEGEGNSNPIDASRVDLTKQRSARPIEASVEAKSEEWGEADDEMLKKLMGKHPVGKPGRWEAIAEGFKGKHKVETVIAKAKHVGDKKGGDQDSYSKFLKDREKRHVDEEGRKESGSGWTAAEDVALLNALKAFPKEVAMRWEKVAASVPGKTKAACVARMAELKKDFRSSKASASAQLS
ncbi:transcription factor MAMYB [Salvia miltiorrhiza]|uniref:transcription factor MAMYB n=1 Tax=Salvia miltiorrhiza TaxID=226208 RepID=UPI0025AD393B|nr:transcription factor MAMYB [Salvia miltiorrhiza]XP_057810278.1 transcription factor MAMYB [Salvia miltiorrhiza]